MNRLGTVSVKLYRARRGAVGDAVLLTLASFALLGHRHGLAMSVIVPLNLMATVPLAASRRYPGLALATVLTASAGFIVFGRLSWPLPAVAGWLAALVLCPLLLPRRTAFTAFCYSEAVVVCAALASSARNNTPWDATAAEALAVLATWGLGESLRVHRQSAAEQKAAAEFVQQLQERDAVARERAAMARELHDVVAHHVSIIAVRAATAPYDRPDLPEPARAVLDEIAGQARAALAELRTVLGVLRADGTQADHSPLPGLSDIPALVQRISDSGTAVALNVAGPARELPGSVELCGYRLVQESLTNIKRHAPGSRARVDVEYLPDGLLIRVRDDGGGRAAPAPVRTGRPLEPQHGFGLAGMRERVAVLEGSLEAGPHPDGGFLVTARLPVPVSVSVSVPDDPA